MKLKLFKIRALALSLAVCYFSTQVALGSIAEANIWKERRRSLSNRPDEKFHPKLAALPAGLSAAPANANNLMNHMPSVGGALPTTSKWIRSRCKQFEKFSYRLRELANSVSPAHASIQDIYDAGNERDSAPVIVIQDVHLNNEAQSNIAGLLQNLIDRKKVGLVGVEGAFGVLDFTLLRSFQNKEIARKVARTFLRRNLLGAPSFVGIVSSVAPPPFVGIDDRPHYEANVNAYLSTRAMTQKINERLSQVNAALNKAKAAHFSSRLRAFDDLCAAYHRGEIGLGAFVTKLSSYGLESDPTVDQFLEAFRLESSLNFEQVARERSQVIEKLTKVLSEKEISDLMAESLSYRLGHIGFGTYYQGLRDLCRQKGIHLQATPAFDNYIRYVLLSDGIKSDRLFEVIQSMEEKEWQVLARSEQQLKLFRLSRRICLIEKLTQFALTPAEWDAYFSGERSLSKMVLELQSLLPTKEPIINEPVSLEPYEVFYQEARIRSEKMVENLLRTFDQSKNSNLKKGNPRQFSDSATELTSGGVGFPASEEKFPAAMALVIGGFHTPDIAHLLKNRKKSYLIVSPKITKIEEGNQASYLAAFAREKTPLDKLIAGEKLFISPLHLTPQYDRTEVELAGSLSVHAGPSEKIPQLDEGGNLVSEISGRTPNKTVFAAKRPPQGYALIETILPGSAYETALCIKKKTVTQSVLAGLALVAAAVRESYNEIVKEAEANEAHDSPKIKSNLLNRAIAIGRMEVYSSFKSKTKMTTNGTVISRSGRSSSVASALYLYLLSRLEENERPRRWMKIAGLLFVGVESAGILGAGWFFDWCFMEPAFFVLAFIAVMVVYAALHIFLAGRIKSKHIERAPPFLNFAQTLLIFSFYLPFVPLLASPISPLMLLIFIPVAVHFLNDIYAMVRMNRVAASILPISQEKKSDQAGTSKTTLLGVILLAVVMIIAAIVMNIRGVRKDEQPAAPQERPRMVQSEKEKTEPRKEPVQTEEQRLQQKAMVAAKRVLAWLENKEKENAGDPNQAAKYKRLAGHLRNQIESGRIKLVAPSESRRNAVMWVMDETIHINSVTFPRVSPAEAEATLAHENAHLGEAQEARAKIVAEMGKKLPPFTSRQFRDPQNGRQLRENLKQVLALMVENELEAYLVEIEYRTAQAQAQGRSLPTYLRILAKETGLQFGKHVYESLAEILEEQDGLSLKDRLRIRFVLPMKLLGPGGPQGLDGWQLLFDIARLEGIDFKDAKGKFEPWALEWLKSKRYNTPVGDREKSKQKDEQDDKAFLESLLRKDKLSEDDIAKADAILRNMPKEDVAVYLKRMEKVLIRQDTKSLWSFSLEDLENEIKKWEAQKAAGALKDQDRVQILREWKSKEEEIFYVGSYKGRLILRLLGRHNRRGTIRMAEVLEEFVGRHPDETAMLIETMVGGPAKPDSRKLINEWKTFWGMIERHNLPYELAPHPFTPAVVSALIKQHPESREEIIAVSFLSFHVQLSPVIDLLMRGEKDELIRSRAAFGLISKLLAQVTGDAEEEVGKIALKYRDQWKKETAARVASSAQKRVAGNVFESNRQTFPEKPDTLIRRAPGRRYIVQYGGKMHDERRSKNEILEAAQELITPNNVRAFLSMADNIHEKDLTKIVDVFKNLNLETLFEAPGREEGRLTPPRYFNGNFLANTPLLQSVSGPVFDRLRDDNSLRGPISPSAGVNSMPVGGLLFMVKDLLAWVLGRPITMEEYSRRPSMYLWENAIPVLFAVLFVAVHLLGLWVGAPVWETTSEAAFMGYQVGWAVFAALHIGDIFYARKVYGTGAQVERAPPISGPLENVLAASLLAFLNMFFLPALLPPFLSGWIFGLALGIVGLLSHWGINAFLSEGDQGQVKVKQENSPSSTLFLSFPFRGILAAAVLLLIFANPVFASPASVQWGIIPSSSVFFWLLIGLAVIGMMVLLSLLIDFAKRAFLGFPLFEMGVVASISGLFAVMLHLVLFPLLAAIFLTSFTMFIFAGLTHLTHKPKYNGFRFLARNEWIFIGSGLGVAALTAGLVKSATAVGLLEGHAFTVFVYAFLSAVILYQILFIKVNAGYDPPIVHLRMEIDDMLDSLRRFFKKPAVWLALFLAVGLGINVRLFLWKTVLTYFEVLKLDTAVTTILMAVVFIIALMILFHRLYRYRRPSFGGEFEAPTHSLRRPSVLKNALLVFVLVYSFLFSIGGMRWYRDNVFPYVRTTFSTTVSAQKEKNDLKWALVTIDELRAYAFAAGVETDENRLAQLQQRAEKLAAAFVVDEAKIEKELARLSQLLSEVEKMMNDPDENLTVTQRNNECLARLNAAAAITQRLLQSDLYALALCISVKTRIDAMKDRGTPDDLLAPWQPGLDLTKAEAERFSARYRPVNAIGTAVYRMLLIFEALGDKTGANYENEVRRYYEVLLELPYAHMESAQTPNAYRHIKDQLRGLSVVSFDEFLTEVQEKYRKAVREEISLALRPGIPVEKVEEHCKKALTLIDLMHMRLHPFLLTSRSWQRESPQTAELKADEALAYFLLSRSAKSESEAKKWRRRAFEAMVQTRNAAPDSRYNADKHPVTARLHEHARELFESTRDFQKDKWDYPPRHMWEQSLQAVDHIDKYPPREGELNPLIFHRLIQSAAQSNDVEEQKKLLKLAEDYLFLKSEYKNGVRIITVDKWSVALSGDFYRRETKPSIALLKQLLLKTNDPVVLKTAGEILYLLIYSVDQKAEDYKTGVNSAPPKDSEFFKTLEMRARQLADQVKQDPDDATTKALVGAFLRVLDVIACETQLEAKDETTVYVRKDSPDFVAYKESFSDQCVQILAPRFHPSSWPLLIALMSSLSAGAWAARERLGQIKQKLHSQEAENAELDDENVPFLTTGATNAAGRRFFQILGIQDPPDALIKILYSPFNAFEMIGFALPFLWPWFWKDHFKNDNLKISLFNYFAMAVGIVFVFLGMVFTPIGLLSILNAGDAVFYSRIVAVALGLLFLATLSDQRRFSIPLTGAFIGFAVVAFFIPAFGFALLGLTATHIAGNAIIALNQWQPHLVKKGAKLSMLGAVVSVGIYFFSLTALSTSLSEALHINALKFIAGMLVVAVTGIAFLLHEYYLSKTAPPDPTVSWLRQLIRLREFSLIRFFVFMTVTCYSIFYVVGGIHFYKRAVLPYTKLTAVKEKFLPDRSLTFTLVPFDVFKARAIAAEPEPDEEKAKWLWKQAVKLSDDYVVDLAVPLKMLEKMKEHITKANVQVESLSEKIYLLNQAERIGAQLLDPRLLSAALHESISDQIRALQERSLSSDPFSPRHRAAVLGKEAAGKMKRRISNVMAEVILLMIQVHTELESTTGKEHKAAILELSTILLDFPFAKIPGSGNPNHFESVSAHGNVSTVDIQQKYLTVARRYIKEAYVPGIEPEKAQALCEQALGVLQRMNSLFYPYKPAWYRSLLYQEEVEETLLLSQIYGKLSDLWEDRDEERAAFYWKLGLAAGFKVWFVQGSRGPFSVLEEIHPRLAKATYKLIQSIKGGDSDPSRRHFEQSVFSLPEINIRPPKAEAKSSVFNRLIRTACLSKDRKEQRGLLKLAQDILIWGVSYQNGALVIDIDRSALESPGYYLPELRELFENTEDTEVLAGAGKLIEIIELADGGRIPGEEATQTTLPFRGYAFKTYEKRARTLREKLEKDPANSKTQFLIRAFSDVLSFVESPKTYHIMGERSYTKTDAPDFILYRKEKTGELRRVLFTYEAPFWFYALSLAGGFVVAGTRRGTKLNKQEINDAPNRTGGKGASSGGKTSSQPLLALRFWKAVPIIGKFADHWWFVIFFVPLLELVGLPGISEGLSFFMGQFAAIAAGAVLFSALHSLFELNLRSPPSTLLLRFVVRSIGAFLITYAAMDPGILVLILNFFDPQASSFLSAFISLQPNLTAVAVAYLGHALWNALITFSAFAVRRFGRSPGMADKIRSFRLMVGKSDSPDDEGEQAKAKTGGPEQFRSREPLSVWDVLGNPGEKSPLGHMALTMGLKDARVVGDPRQFEELTIWTIELSPGDGLTFLKRELSPKASDPRYLLVMRGNCFVGVLPWFNDEARQLMKLMKERYRQLDPGRKPTGSEWTQEKYKWWSIADRVREQVILNLRMQLRGYEFHYLLGSGLDLELPSPGISNEEQEWKELVQARRGDQATLERFFRAEGVPDFPLTQLDYIGPLGFGIEPWAWVTMDLKEGKMLAGQISDTGDRQIGSNINTTDPDKFGAVIRIFGTVYSPGVKDVFEDDEHYHSSVLRAARQYESMTGKRWQGKKRILVVGPGSGIDTLEALLESLRQSGINDRGRGYTLPELVNYHKEFGQAPEWAPTIHARDVNPMAIANVRSLFDSLDVGFVLKAEQGLNVPERVPADERYDLIIWSMPVLPSLEELESGDAWEADRAVKFHDGGMNGLRALRVLVERLPHILDGIGIFWNYSTLDRSGKDFAENELNKTGFKVVAFTGRAARNAATYFVVAQPKEKFASPTATFSLTYLFNRYAYSWFRLFFGLKSIPGEEVPIKVAPWFETIVIVALFLIFSTAYFNSLSAFVGMDPLSPMMEIILINIFFSLDHSWKPNEGARTQAPPQSAFGRFADAFVRSASYRFFILFIVGIVFHTPLLYMLSTFSSQTEPVLLLLAFMWAWVSHWLYNSAVLQRGFNWLNTAAKALGLPLATVFPKTAEPSHWKVRASSAMGEKGLSKQLIFDLVMNGEELELGVERQTERLAKEVSNVLDKRHTAFLVNEDLARFLTTGVAEGGENWLQLLAGIKQTNPREGKIVLFAEQSVARMLKDHLPDDPELRRVIAIESFQRAKPAFSDDKIHVARLRKGLASHGVSSAEFDDVNLIAPFDVSRLQPVTESAEDEKFVALVLKRVILWMIKSRDIDRIKNRYRNETATKKSA